jgi:hypothetical protein
MALQNQVMQRLKIGLPENNIPLNLIEKPMEDQKNIVVQKDIGILQNPASHSDAMGTDSDETQHENNYDSHSEKKPHQKTSVSKDAKPDRVSHDTRDTTSKKAVVRTDLVRKEEEHDDSSEASESELFPKSDSSSFPSIS